MTSRTFAQAPLREKHQVARDTWVLDYEFPLTADLIPGQFAMVHPGADHEFILPRPLSILDAEGERLQLLIKVVGRGTRAMVDAPLGSPVRIFAPLGNGFDLGALGEKELVLVAGGVGVVPLHLAARRLRESGRPARRCLFGARRPEDLPLPLWQDGRAGDWELWVEEQAGEALREGRVTGGVAEALEEFPGAVLLACGPTPMMQAVGRMGREAGSEVWLCLEEQMGCGAGVCRACVVEPRDRSAAAKLTVCRQGPVFRLDEIRYLPEEIAEEPANA